MTTRARVLTTLVVVLGLATWEWCYLGWPRWFGTEIRVPVQVGTRGGPKGLAVPFYPEWHLQLDASNTQETGRPATPTVHVRSIGVVWNPRVSAQAAAASLRSRIDKGWPPESHDGVTDVFVDGGTVRQGDFGHFRKILVEVFGQ